MYRPYRRAVEAHPTGRRRSGGGEGGFALIAALLTLVGITALATAGFLVSDGDYRVAVNHRSSVTAFYASDAGRNEYMGTQGFPSGGEDYVYGAQSAVVRSRRLLELPDGLRLYMVSSNGARPEPRGGTATRLTRSVAVWTPLPLSVPGAFTAINGLRKNGAAGTITGVDAAPPGPCPGGESYGDQPAVAGVAVPPAGYQQNGGGHLVPEGDPPVADTLNGLQLVASTDVDWNGIVNEEKVEADYMIPAGPWPDYTAIPADEWPVIHITSSHFDLGPGHSGWGTIILDGDISMHGDFEWDGLILAGGRLVSDGTQQIWGAMYTGLNILLGETVGTSDVGNGSKTYRFHSCNIEAAKRAMGWLTEKPGSWFEVM